MYIRLAAKKNTRNKGGKRWIRVKDKGTIRILIWKKKKWAIPRSYGLMQKVHRKALMNLRTANFMRERVRGIKSIRYTREWKVKDPRKRSEISRVPTGLGKRCTQGIKRIDFSYLDTRKSRRNKGINRENTNEWKGLTNWKNVVRYAEIQQA